MSDESAGGTPASKQKVLCLHVLFFDGQLRSLLPAKDNTITRDGMNVTDGHSTHHLISFVDTWIVTEACLDHRLAEKYDEERGVGTHHDWCLRYV